MKSLLILTVLFSWPIFAKQIISTSRGVLGQVTGAVNDKSRGVFDRQKKFRAKERSEGWNEFKGGQRGGRVGGALGLGVGVVAGAKRGTRGQLLTREGRRQAATRQRQIEAAKNAQDNRHLQQLMLNSDEGGAVMALSGGTEEGAEQARDDLFNQWMDPHRQRLANGEIDQAEFDRIEQEQTVRADTALTAARAVGVNRRNAQSALNLMAQNKARAIDAGNWEIVQAGINRLGRNDQEAADLRDSFQYHARGAGRFDIGANDARGGVNRASLGQLASAHPSTIRGVAAAHGATFTEPGDHSDQERTAAMRFYNEIESALPYATGEVRDAMLETLNNPEVVQARNAWLSQGPLVEDRSRPITETLTVPHPTIPDATVTQTVQVTAPDPATGAPVPQYAQRTQRQIDSENYLRTLQSRPGDPNNPFTPPPPPAAGP